MSYNNISYGESLGTTGHHPKHSIAYKFYDEESVTTLRDIEWSMGKTGNLTPVAIFDSVEIDGTDVIRASLHNVSICKELQLGIDDEIIVYKANMIIPQVAYNLTKSNNFIILDRCPVCGGSTEITKDKDTEILICTNGNCKGKLLRRLTHFVSKNAINVDGLSEATLEKFIELGWLNSLINIYSLKNFKEKMYQLEGFGKKSVDKLLDNIEKSRSTTLDRFIYSLSIPLIGRTASKTISKWFNSDAERFFNAWMCESGFDFNALEDFGNNMNTSMQNFIKHNYIWLSCFIDIFNFEQSKAVPVTDNLKNLSGKTFVITGSLNTFPNRDEAKDEIKRLGGKVSDSVSSKTSFLVNNDTESTSGKNQKAKKLGIPIISEEELLQMIR